MSAWMFRVGDKVVYPNHGVGVIEQIADGEAVMYNEPGRMVAIGGSKAPAFFVFASPELRYDRYDAEQQADVLRNMTSNPADYTGRQPQPAKEENNGTQHPNGPAPLCESYHGQELPVHPNGKERP